MKSSALVFRDERTYIVLNFFFLEWAWKLGKPNSRWSRPEQTCMMLSSLCIGRFVLLRCFLPPYTQTKDESLRRKRGSLHWNAMTHELGRPLKHLRFAVSSSCRCYIYLIYGAACIFARGELKIWMWIYGQIKRSFNYCVTIFYKIRSKVVK